jgi:hypothetical protein
MDLSDINSHSGICSNAGRILRFATLIAMPSRKALAREIDGLVDTVVMRAALTMMHAQT